jgi:hypothetical protein
VSTTGRTSSSSRLRFHLGFHDQPVLKWAFRTHLLGRTLPFARCLRRLAKPTKTTPTEHARPSRGRRSDQDRRSCPSSSSLQDEGSVEVCYSHDLIASGGPSWIQPTVTGPAWISILWVASVIAFSIMTVCNLVL